MAYVKKLEAHDGHQGGWLEAGQFTLDPASIAASARGVSTVTIVGVRAGDMVFVQPELLEANVVVTGAKVTADDTVSVYINNTIDATTAVDSASLTYNILIVHYAS